MLIETNGKKEGIMVVGIGVNLKDYPKQTTTYPATSLYNSIDKIIKPKSFAVYMRVRLLHLLKQDDIHKRWLTRAINKNQEIKVNLRNNTIVGIFKGVNKKGHLLLETQEGEKISISAGDVFF